MPPFEESFHNQISKVIVGALQATPMADTSDYIPANGIRFDRAFERLFDADPAWQ
jgi:hypothetical protein